MNSDKWLNSGCTLFVPVWTQHVHCCMKHPWSWTKHLWETVKETYLNSVYAKQYWLESVGLPVWFYPNKFYVEPREVGCNPKSKRLVCRWCSFSTGCGCRCGCCRRRFPSIYAYRGIYWTCVKQVEPWSWESKHTPQSKATSPSPQEIRPSWGTIAPLKTSPLMKWWLGVQLSFLKWSLFRGHFNFWRGIHHDSLYKVRYS